MDEEKYIPVRNSQINYYKKFPLYYETTPNNYALYKPAGTSLEKLRLDGTKHPKLFIDHKDRITSIKLLQKQFNRDLKKSFLKGDFIEVKDILVNLVGETLSEPRSGTLDALPDTVNIVFEGFSTQPDLLKTIAAFPFKDYTTVIHSVNLMALVMGFCFYRKFPPEKTRQLSLSALLHDIGKTQIPNVILTAERKLTQKEFETMKSHTTIGCKIIRENNMLEKSIAIGALEHHEKLDGSGYPNGITDISYDGQLLSLLDCYEALTNEDRPYRRAKKPFETMLLLKSDLQAGKFNKTIFEQLCVSLL